MSTKEIDIMPKQDALYVCMICHAMTPHFNKVCASCEDPNGGDKGDD